MPPQIDDYIEDLSRYRSKVTMKYLRTLHVPADATTEQLAALLRTELDDGRVHAFAQTLPYFDVNWVRALLPESTDFVAHAVQYRQQHSVFPWEFVTADAAGIGGY